MLLPKTFNRFILMLILSKSLSHGFNIIIVISVPMRSHDILARSLSDKLIDSGHNVTLVSPFFETNQQATINFTQIQLNQVNKIWPDIRDTLYSGSTTKIHLNINLIPNIINGLNIWCNLTESALSDKNFQEILHNPSNTFDLIIISQVSNHALFGLSEHFNAPIILLAASGISSLIHDLVGNSVPLSYAPQQFLPYTDQMNFRQRLTNTLIYTSVTILRQTYLYPKQAVLLRQYFPNSTQSLQQIISNAVALVLSNSDPSFEYAQPLVPNIIEIGGFHVKLKHNMDSKLQQFLDSAKDGVIYLSFGSSVKSKDISKEIIQSFVESFGQLKQKVVWKFDTEELPNLPANVYLRKWLPQTNVLAHPNVKVFITQGGLLSLTEAITYGVPILGIPIFGDQQSNVFRAVYYEFGIYLDFQNITRVSLMWALNELISNSKYSEEAKRRSNLMNEQLVAKDRKAIYWIEYIVRHKGAKHLRTVGKDLYFYQYLLLDVIFFLMSITIFSFILLFVCTRKILSRFRSKIPKSKNE